MVQPDVSFLLGQASTPLPAPPHPVLTSAPANPSPKGGHGRLWPRAGVSPEGVPLPQDLKQMFIKFLQVPGLLLGAGDPSANVNTGSGIGDWCTPPPPAISSLPSAPPAPASPSSILSPASFLFRASLLPLVLHPHPFCVLLQSQEAQAMLLGSFYLPL